MILPDQIPYQIYTHSIDGAVVYVGCGKDPRPYDFSARSKEWKDLARGKQVEVSVVSTTQCPTRAARIERKLIEKFRPKLNKSLPWSSKVRSVLIGEDLHKEMRRRAKQEGISMNYLYNKIIRYFVEGQFDAVLMRITDRSNVHGTDRS